MTCVEWRPHPIGGGSLCWTLGYRGRNTPVQPQDSPVWAFFPRCGCKHGKVHHRRGLREPGQARCPKLWSRGLWVLALLCWLPGSGGVRPQTLLTSALCPLTGAQHCPRSFGCCDSGHLSCMVSLPQRGPCARVASMAGPKVTGRGSHGTVSF